MIFLENFTFLDNERFLMRHHKEMFGGLENKWDDYKIGKFRYEIEFLSGLVLIQ